MSRPTPKFDNPPVIETVLGVEFDPLTKWDIPHFGLFWQNIREEYQQHSVVPPLASQIEKFGAWPKNEAFISFLEKPEVRCWYFNDAGTWLMQVQNDRFLHNWRKRNEAYPHYEEAQRRFLISWNHFCQFLESEGIEKPLVRQCEVTYINHIELNEDSALSELSEMFPAWAGNSSSEYLSQPEAVVLNTIYRLPDDKGRLRIVMQPVIRHADLKRIIQLELTARVFTSSDNDEISSSLDCGHEWVVNSFADFTSPGMHEIWKRTQ
jgi:uncharacterized protein (TIGR04255 family)